MEIELLNKRIEAGLKVGKNSYVHGYIEKFHPEWITIGKNVIIGIDTRIITHGPIRPYMKYPTILIDDLAWVGIRCIVLPGVKIGKCALIGAGSVVTKNVPSYHTAAGNPAKVIGKREKNEIKRFYITKWLMNISPGKVLSVDMNMMKESHIKYVFGDNYEYFNSIVDVKKTHK